MKSIAINNLISSSESLRSILLLERTENEIVFTRKSETPKSSKDSLIALTKATEMIDIKNNKVNENMFAFYNNDMTDKVQTSPRLTEQIRSSPLTFATAESTDDISHKLKDPTRDIDESRSSFPMNRFLITDRSQKYGVPAIVKRQTDNFSGDTEMVVGTFQAIMRPATLPAIPNVPGTNKKQEVD